MKETNESISGRTIESCSLMSQYLTNKGECSLLDVFSDVLVLFSAVQF
jgi:hypothetical protein